MKYVKLFKKADMAVYLFWGLLALGLFLFSAFGIRKSVSDARLTVISGNKTYGVYDLDRDQTIDIGDGNRCEIKNGEVSMVYADCPDKLCMHSRPVSDVGESIVCIPNNVILKITGDDSDSDIDAISE